MNFWNNKKAFWRYLIILIQPICNFIKEGLYFCIYTDFNFISN